MKHKRRVAILLLSLTVCQVLTAANDEKQPSGIWRAVMAVKTYIDSSTVKGCDPDYIMAPRRP